MIPSVFDDFIVVAGGMKRVSELTPVRDYVIEYKTNEKLSIYNVERVPSTLLKVRLSDGTDAIIFASDYTEDELILYPIDFGISVMSSMMYDLDPYTVGVLLAHGDYTDEYVNSPALFPAVQQYIARKNNWDTDPELGNVDKYYYAHRYSDHRLVRWEEVFDKVGCNVMDSRYPVFPNELAMGSFRVRRQLLSGVFDIGYTKEPFDNRLQISSPYEERLFAVRDILKSLGITSRISLYKDLYILTVTGDYDNTTGLFYKVEHIEDMVRNNNWNMVRNSEPLHIEMVIEEEHNCMVWVPCFTDGMFHSYIDSNFLRRRTIPLYS